ncbi:zinc finger MYM-type protein 1-like [Palaemon carinicauda]|uniref:zinc finger MYM-type protein 1-like n=1 Tax=Palaemon carinicauda TaxID=392227 RepID=UPI0035B601DF
MILQYVDIKKEPEVSQHHVYIKESILGFVPLKETTGAFMTETLVDELQNMGLQIDNLCGQGYDNGSNMKGKRNGLRQCVLDMNPHAFFVSCSAHSLNLGVNGAVKCCLQATKFFGIVQHLYNFFSTSTHRRQVLVSIIKDLTIKPLSETRWESQIDALNTLRYLLADIYDALLGTYEDINLKGSSGSLPQIEAKGLADAVSKYEFVVSLVTWYNILFEVNITIKHLQDKDADLNSATRHFYIPTKQYLASYDIHGIKNAPTTDILHDCQNLEKSLTHNGHHNIDARDLCSKLKAVSRRLTKPMLPQAALDFIFEQKLQDCASNIVTVLRILLTLPVSVASGERSSSKLKLIKTYLRSTMLQQRLVGLATLSIENEEASNLNLAKLVEKFASLKIGKWNCIDDTEENSDDIYNGVLLDLENNASSHSDSDHVESDRLLKDYDPP